MSLENFEHVYLAKEKPFVDHNHAFLSHQGRERNMHDGRGSFRGRSSNNFLKNDPNSNHNYQASNSKIPSNSNNKGKGPPMQQIKEFAKFVKEQITLPQNGIIDMNIMVKIKTPKKL